MERRDLRQPFRQKRAFGYRKLEATLEAAGRPWRADLRLRPGTIHALDGENGQVVIKLLQRAAKARDAAVVCVTHDPRLEAYADRIVHIEDGRILDDRRTAHAGPLAAAKPELIGA